VGPVAPCRSAVRRAPEGVGRVRSVTTHGVRRTPDLVVRRWSRRRPRRHPSGW
jgi:hypothetical protein